MHTDALNEFMQENPDFIGSKFIYAPLRNVEKHRIDEYLETVKELHLKFPNFIAGFDLVGQEDLGRPLIDFAPELLKLPDDIKFFLHAGETNWFGTSTDENLVNKYAYKYKYYSKYSLIPLYICRWMPFY